jgi:hypothetical protein
MEEEVTVAEDGSEAVPDRAAHRVSLSPSHGMDVLEETSNDSSTPPEPSAKRQRTNLISVDQTLGNDGQPGTAKDNDEAGEKPEETDQKIGSKQGPSNLKETPHTSSASSTVRMDPAMVESLTCSICTQIFHQCVAVWPCMHGFCGSCLSEWVFKFGKEVS